MTRSCVTTDKEIDGKCSVLWGDHMYPLTIIKDYELEPIKENFALILHGKFLILGVFMFQATGLST